MGRVRQSTGLGSKDSGSAPPKPANVERLGEDVVVDDASVERKETHQQQDVTAAEEDVPDLRETKDKVEYAVLPYAIHWWYHTHSALGEGGASDTLTLTSPLILAAMSCLSRSTIQAENSSMMVAWPASPNMTANRNGKVVVVYRAVEKKR
ncbi:hypothetical protein E2C01_028172 [Portunus trituberculatus]|uniref:Uncharacterized protein n=1 Tax=Portunus trituberculatus TaxID=210409 RepID=A0A5B7EKN1_PORTR|nr:hypothetical protein [Portunus trituberculatus]